MGNVDLRLLHGSHVLVKDMNGSKQHHDAHHRHPHIENDERNLENDRLLAGHRLLHNDLPSVDDHHQGKNDGYQMAEEHQGIFRLRDQLEQNIHLDHGSVLHGRAATDQRGVNDNLPDQFFGPGQGIVDDIAQDDVYKERDQDHHDGDEQGPIFEKSQNGVYDIECFLEHQGTFIDKGLPWSNEISFVDELLRFGAFDPGIFHPKTFYPSWVNAIIPVSAQMGYASS
jgi:hypothetical protein